MYTDKNNLLHGNIEINTNSKCGIDSTGNSLYL